MENNTLDLVPIQDGESPIRNATDEGITHADMEDRKQREEEIREVIEEQRYIREAEQRQVKEVKKQKKKFIRNIIIAVVVALAVIAVIVVITIKIKDIKRGIRALNRRIRKQMLINRLRRYRRPGRCKKRCEKGKCKCGSLDIKFTHGKYRDNMKGFWYNKGMHDFINGRYHGGNASNSSQPEQPKKKLITDSMNQGTEVKTDELVLHGTIDDKEVTVVNPLRKILSQTTDETNLYPSKFLLQESFENESDSDDEEDKPKKDVATSKQYEETKDIKNMKNVNYVLLTGGFGDNIKAYALKYYFPHKNFIFINVPNTKELATRLRSPKHYLDLIEHKNLLEVGQKTTNMSLFNFPDVINYIPNTDKKILTMYDYGKLLRVFGMQPFLMKIRHELSKYLLSPKVKYSDYCLKVYNRIKDEEYAMLGVRWRYPCINECGNIFLSGNNKKFVTEQIPDFLRKNNNIILVFDDWKMLELFRVMYYDILYNDGNYKNVITLQPIGPNDIHDLLKIASCIELKNFLHNYSGFYQILSLVMS